MRVHECSATIEDPGGVPLRRCCRYIDFAYYVYTM